MSENKGTQAKEKKPIREMIGAWRVAFVLRLLLVGFAVPGLFLNALFSTGCGQRTPLPSGTSSNGSAGSAASAASFNFVDVTKQAGITWLRDDGAYGGKLFPESVGAGGAFLDYDNDGYLDILLINGDWWPGHPLSGSRPTLALYHNDHDGTFTDVTTKMGLNISMQGMGVAVGDYDNDGYDDILLTGVGGNRLIHNAGGKRFTDVTALSGVGGSGWSTSAAWVDYDNDGKLDLFVCHYCKWSLAKDIYCGGQIKIYCSPEAYPGESCRLYHNEGHGHFKDVTQQAGLLNERGKALGICTVDFDHDGKIDFIVANDGEPTIAYKNMGGGKFKDVSAESGLALGENGQARNGMGIDAADYQNDGAIGVLIGNFSYQGVGLHHEIGPSLFADVAQNAGVQQPSLPYVTFGALFGDFDNDGWKDILITNGHTDDMTERSLPEQHVLQPTQLFANLRNGKFAEVTKQAGPGLAQQLVGRGLAIGDFDNDGRLDLLLIQNAGPPRLLHNESISKNHWITLAFVGTKSNRDGYGTEVRLTAGGITQSDRVHSGSSYCSASDRRLHFGLGTAALAEKIEVKWPSGLKEVIGPLAADKIWTLTEGHTPVSKSPTSTK